VCFVDDNDAVKCDDVRQLIFAVRLFDDVYSKLVRSKLDGLIERSACACVSVTLS